MGRQRCGGCERPASVCLCEQLPVPPLQTTRTSVVVLQHPHEARHKLSTLPILSKCLANNNCHILRGRRFQAGCSPLLDLCVSQPLYSPSVHALLLFPTPSALPIATWYHQVTSSSHPRSVVRPPLPDVTPSCSLQDDSCSPCARTRLSSGDIELSASDPRTDDSMQICKSNTQAAFDLNSCQHASQARDANSFLGFPHIVLIAVDATWQHAKEMIKASAPYLSKFAIPVCLPFHPDEEGSCMASSESIIRKEPFKGCMTTLEAIACCLKVLEPNGVEVHDKLLHVLRSVVQFQASNIVLHKVRTKKQSKSTVTIYRGDISSQ